MSHSSVFAKLSVSAVAALSITGALSSPALASAHHMFEDELELRAAAAANGSDEAGAWNGPNSPTSWNTSYEYRLDSLPTDGGMEDHTPWSDTYWPSQKAGIAARWNMEGSNGFKYALLNEEQVSRLSPAELARLSPAEKYDILMGRFDYPTVKMVRSATSPHAQSWEGICHGWSPAAINHAEPAPVTVTSDQGISIPFGSADVKGLLDNYYANNAVASHFLGERCGKSAGSDRNILRSLLGIFHGQSACDDVNAGALHVILTNELGIRHQGFVADVDRYRQVWNQPVYGFSSRMIGTRRPSPDAAPGTVKEVLVHTEMTYAEEIDPTWSPVVGTAQFNSKAAIYDYSLEMDSEGRIIGGQYYLKSNQARPDFLWNAPKLQFTGYAEGLNRIYRPAAQAQTRAQ